MKVLDVRLLYAVALYTTQNGITACTEYHVNFSLYSAYCFVLLSVTAL
jgi:hypothetical protein